MNIENHLPVQSVHDSAVAEVKWQKHVMAFLWILLALFIVVGAALLYADGHGLFQTVPNRTAPLPHSWPADQ